MRGALSVEGRSQVVSVALAASTLAGTMSEECRLEECAESIWPSRICAQLHGTWIFTVDTRAFAVGANAGGSNAGMVSAGPM
jgi:hypothetical protein